MYAILQAGGTQFRVSPGDTIVMNKIDGECGSPIEFKNILMVVDHDSGRIDVGAPFVEGVSVAAEIIRQTKGEKITVFKSKRRKGYRRKMGHRQLLTELVIKEITA